MKNTKTDLGVIRIHQDVISSIAYNAAMQTEGVASIGTSLTSKIYQLLGKKNKPSISVEIDKNNEVSVEIPVFVKYGVYIPELAAKIQDNVGAALDKMTDCIIKDINVNIQGIERSN